MPESKFIDWIGWKEAEKLVGAGLGMGKARWLEPSNSSLHHRYVTRIASYLGWQGKAFQTPDGARFASTMQPIRGKLR